MNSAIAEYFPPPDGIPDANELFWRVFEGEPRAEGGYITLPGVPGLGLDLNQDVIDVHRIG